jgi:methylated-DNA-[protein]-cysteine S-methyltransferase
LPIDESPWTPFQKRVIDVCRSIPWGSTLTYGQVAALAGSPGASRAVGSVMAKNRFPLIVPCHRVIGSNGLGGFSAPDGLKLKSRLLANEGTIPAKCAAL